MTQAPRRFELVRRDMSRYFDMDGETCLLQKWRIVLETPGLQATLVYRFGAWVDRAVPFLPFRIPLKALYFLLNKLSIILWGIHIDVHACIGGGLYLGHFGGILIGPVTMGEDCNVNHQVTMGRRADGTEGVPVLGSRVWVGAGSILFGGIHVGDGVTVGPLTLVSRNLPAKVMVIGNPMRLLRKDYDNRVEIYGKGGKK